MTDDQIGHLLAAWGAGFMMGAIGLWLAWRWLIGKDWWRP